MGGSDVNYVADVEICASVAVFALVDAEHLYGLPIALSVVVLEDEDI